jgi:hypothetical protein
VIHVQVPVAERGGVPLFHAGPGRRFVGTAIGPWGHKGFRRHREIQQRLAQGFVFLRPGQPLLGIRLKRSRLLLHHRTGPAGASPFRQAVPLGLRPLQFRKVVCFPTVRQHLAGLIQEPEGVLIGLVLPGLGGDALLQE